MHQLSILDIDPARKRLVELVHLLVGFYRLIGKRANAYRNGGKGCDHKSADTQQSLQCGAEGTR